MTDFKNQGQAKKAEQADKENMGRSAEARDPDRPVDPVTGEKMPLPPRYPDRPDDELEEPLEEPLEDPETLP